MAKPVLVLLTILVVGVVQSLGGPVGDQDQIDGMTIMRQQLEGQMQVNQTAKDQSCSCSGYKCSCCAEIAISMFSPVCANVEYVASTFMVKVSLTVAGSVVFEKSITAKDPPPLCFNIPKMKDTRACLDIYDIYLDKDVFKGCIKVSLTWKSVPFNIKLGCWSFPLHKLYQEYMLQEIGIPEADGRILDQWVKALVKARMTKKFQYAMMESL